MENKAKDIEAFYAEHKSRIGGKVVVLNTDIATLLVQQETFYREKAKELNLPLEWVKELFKPELED